jgi:hypothetical protein
VILFEFYIHIILCVCITENIGHPFHIFMLKKNNNNQQKNEFYRSKGEINKN